MSEKIPNYLKWAIIWAISYSLCASIMVGMIRHLSTEIHPTAILFYRYALALIIFTPIFFGKRHHLLKTKKIRIHFVRGGIGFGAMALWFYGISLLPVAESVSLNFTAPLFAVLIAVIWLKESVSFTRLIALFIGFSGMLIILRPGVEIIHYASFVVLISSVLMAISATLNKSLSKTDDPKTIVFYFTLMATPLALILSIPYFVVPDISQLIWLIGIALISTLMQFSLSKAVSMADMSVLIPFDFTRLIFASIIGIIFFSEYPDKYTVIGATIIIISSTFLAYKESGGKNKP